MRFKFRFVVTASYANKYKCIVLFVINKFLNLFSLNIIFIDQIKEAYKYLNDVNGPKQNMTSTHNNI